MNTESDEYGPDPEDGSYYTGGVTKDQKKAIIVTLIVSVVTWTLILMYFFNII